MNAAWEYAKKIADRHAAGASLFVHLQNDGDRVVVVFCGDPHAREMYWDGQTYVAMPPAGAAGLRPSVRISINVFVPAENAMKAFEGGPAWFRELVEVRDKYGLQRWCFEIRRRGRKGDPKTRYSILPDAQIDEGLRARIAATPLHDLAAMASGTDADAEFPPAADTQAVPVIIDEDTARALVDRLRPMPREVTQAFLAEFRIGRVRDLANADLPRALRFLEQRKGTATAERDPFEL